MEINEYLIKFFQLAKEIEGVELFPQTATFSGTEFRMLREIILDGESGKQVISSELARRLGVTRSAISQIVTKLEKQNIVQRVSSDTDRKIAYVELTDYAREVFLRQCEEANKIVEAVVEEFGGRNVDALVTACFELSKTFRKVVEAKQNAEVTAKN